MMFSIKGESKNMVYRDLNDRFWYSCLMRYSRVNILFSSKGK